MGPLGRVSVRAAIASVLLMLLAVPLPVSAAGTAARSTTTYHDSVLGLELPPSQASGIDCSAPQYAPFFGGASGDLPGSWYAFVPHTQLSPSARVCPGGQFGLTTELNGTPTTVAGSFVSGSVVQTSSVCPGTQTYQVAATLTVTASVGGRGRQRSGSL